MPIMITFEYFKFLMFFLNSCHCLEIENGNLALIVL